MRPGVEKIVSQGRGIDHVVVAVRNLERAAETYARLGFTLTPRARHPWGTANRLAQFQGQNFIEFLEINRPELLFDHDRAADPPLFSFGAFNRDFLEGGEGMSMLVLTGDDSRADVERFRAAGLKTYAPFDFERDAALPDGTTVKVAFSLAFATNTEMPRAAFFTCHNRFPENFWKPHYQTHPNGARSVAETVMVAEDPPRYAGFLSGFTGGRPEAIDRAIRVSCGPHLLSLLSPKTFAERFPAEDIDLSTGPRFAAIVIEGPEVTAGVTPAAEACGVAIEWRRTA
jgi:catechol 2,3-dioxygenase-like lactoylglutathione lyase family enzyme